MLSPHRMLILKELGESGSIAAAARNLGYTQPALAHHLRELEAEAGIALTRRVGRVVRLTEAGDLLAKRASSIQAELSAAQDEIASLSRLESGTVRVAAFPSFAGRILPGVLGDLASSHPGIEMRIIEAEPPETLELLLNDGCDLAATFTDSDRATEHLPARLHRVDLGSDPVRLVLPAAHALAKRKRVGLGTLADERWMAGCERCRAQLDRLAEEAGFAPDVVYGTDDYVARQKFIAAGLGVSLMPQLALEVYQDPGVIAVDVTGAPSRLVSIVGPVVASPATTAVMEALVRRWGDRDTG